MEPFRISASQISLYAICPRKYRYQYLEDRQRPEQPAALAFGSAVHAAIEWAGRKLSRQGVFDIKEVLSIFRADLEAQSQGDPPLTFKGGERLQDLVRLGEQLVPLALRELGKTEPAAIEEPFEVALEGVELEDGTPIHLVGVFDRLEQDGSVVEVKTAKKRYTQTDLNQHLQATAYSLARKLKVGTIPSVRLLVLVKSGSPDAVWYETRRSPQELSWFSRLVAETVAAIDRGSYPPRISWACETCEFRKMCAREGVAISRFDARPQLVGISGGA